MKLVHSQYYLNFLNNINNRIATKINIKIPLPKVGSPNIKKSKSSNPGTSENTYRKIEEKRIPKSSKKNIFIDNLLSIFLIVS